jgi:outer membrane protein assembly factor BamB
MGRASFRTNVIVNKDELIIGSNGNGFMDYYLLDKESGVYRINRKSGNVNKVIANEPLGDMDVNGVLFLDQKLYFGNDNEEFLCTDMNGKIIFRNPASGDIEHEPVLINNKGVNTIVYASERGEIRAVSPTTGNTIWTYYTPDFTGWKPGNNRSVFKIGAYFSNTSSFFTKPLVYDLNRDGVMDLLYLTFDNKLYAINGVNGNLLWLFNSESKMNYMCTIVGNGNNKIIQMISSVKDTAGQYSSNLLSIDLKGNIVKTKKINCNYSYYSDNGLNAISLTGSSIIMNTRNSLLISDGKDSLHSIDRTITYMRKDYFTNNMITDIRNGSDVLLGDKVFPFEDSKQTVVVLNQWDVVANGTGFIEIVSLDQEKVLKRLKINAYSEMPPVICDINKDGYLDLLINCSDGFLYCYNLKVKV